MEASTKPKVIDLFAGAGGFGLGFQLAGFQVPLSIEIDAWACETLHYNNPGTNVLQEDLTSFDSTHDVRSTFPESPEIIAGGPPCQGFSVSGPANKDPKDPRNSLFNNFALWVEALEPKAFVMENVKGIMSRRNAEGEKVIEIISRIFMELGYLTEVWILNAAEYGVPQSRERVFIVGQRSKDKIGAPLNTHSSSEDHYSTEETQLGLFEERELSPQITLWEAVSDLPELSSKEGDEEQTYDSEPLSQYQRYIRGSQSILYNHAAMHHSKRLVERFKVVGWGESSSEVPDEHKARKRNGNGGLSSKMYDQNNRRLHPYKPSHTITASFYANFIHPFQHRNLTAREGARLQSFPDNYRFLGKKTVVSQKLLHRENRNSEAFLCQYNQIGNAVPPLLAKAVANRLREVL